MQACEVTALLAKVRFLDWPLPDWTTLPPAFIAMYEAMDLGFQEGRQEREAAAADAALVDDMADDAQKKARDLVLGKATL